jgi:hypothetical protein
LAALWEHALHQGDIPGAFWALLTHRDATPELCNKAFGDVHMLSHLVGAANQADIRRLVPLEKENTELRERLEQQQLRSQEALSERDQAVARLQKDLADAQGRHAAAQAFEGLKAPASLWHEELRAQSELVAVQTGRRERAEGAAAAARAEVTRLQQDLEHYRQHIGVLNNELSAAEIQLREMSIDAVETKPAALEAHLRGRRILYVGGRPSSTPAIRSLVQRCGGDFQRHDGGFEDRKGLLASAVAAADLVVFPVDCIDHDSVTNLKRLCARQSVAFVPMRNASVTCFAAAVSSQSGSAEPTRCRRS